MSADRRRPSDAELAELLEDAARRLRALDERRTPGRRRPATRAKAPAAAARDAAEVAPPDDLARERARRALARMRAG